MRNTEVKEIAHAYNAVVILLIMLISSCGVEDIRPPVGLMLVCTEIENCGTTDTAINVQDHCSLGDNWKKEMLDDCIDQASMHTCRMEPWTCRVHCTLKSFNPCD